MKEILVIGGGFAGLWSAASAARAAELFGQRVRITLVNRDDQHSIRVRNYEDDLAPARVPLRSVLEPIGVKLQVGQAIHIDTTRRTVRVDASTGSDGHARQASTRPAAGGRKTSAPVGQPASGRADAEAADLTLRYDKLVLASGSHLERPSLPGASSFLFDVDTYAAALRLNAHIAALPGLPPGPGRYTAVVAGSGATGVEIACELPRRLRAVAREPVRVILIDRGAQIAGHLGGAQAVIEQSCRALGIELMPGVWIAELDDDGLRLSNGMHIDAATIVWCAGMRASPLTYCIPGERDPQGRLFVDAYLRVQDVPDVFAAGDVAHALIDGEHSSVMSCQHARPMGRYAGHNAVCELFGQPPRALNIDWYTNIIDLGEAGAVYAQGWDRTVVGTGRQAKATKYEINRNRIYPPRSGKRADILAAAAPEIQRPPVLKPLDE